MSNEEMKDQLSINNDADVNNPQAEIENTDNKELKYQIEEVSEEDIEVDEAETQRYDKLDLDQINEEFAKVLENKNKFYIKTIYNNYGHDFDFVQKTVKDVNVFLNKYFLPLN